MVKNLIIYIFIYTLLVGCNTQNPLNSECESDFTMNVGATELEMDENGYYHIEWLEGYNQTFATLEAVTNTEGYNRIYWSCDSGIQHEDSFVSCVNPASYTSDGVALQTMAVWEEMIGDTIKIYARFEDWCYNEHIDSIGVIIENEI
tara:strand:+ start:32 stop:472 length:441 start_codon:yes stop_codon:yes gene_type:complete